MLQTGSLSPQFFEKKSSSAMHKLSTGIRILFYLHKITACFRILLCSSTQIYYKMNCHNSAKIICTLYKIRAQQQWIEKQVFAISSHIYQTVSQDYLLLHKISVPQSFAKNTAIQTSQELQQKLVLQVMSKTDYKKAYEHILPQLLL